jgi:uncharacterized protein (DUF2249 family)/hemerythrin-like domain-containing protein
MNTLTEAIRNHHLSLAKTLQAHAHGVGGGESQVERDAFVRFLKGDLMPHANGEERHLYALVDTLVRKHGKPTATMVVDHEFIADYVAKIEEISRRLASATCGDGRDHLLRRLRDLALRLDAIVELHLAKEERIYLPLIEEHVDEEGQGNVLRAIHGSYEKEKRVREDLPRDVRNVVPRERHTLIFDTFAGLKAGEAFVLINDHDPRPLYYQFQAEHTGQFSWDYLQQGPEVWRVRIGRNA